MVAAVRESCCRFASPRDRLLAAEVGGAGGRRLHLEGRESRGGLRALGADGLVQGHEAGVLESGHLGDAQVGPGGHLGLEHGAARHQRGFQILRDAHHHGSSFHGLLQPAQIHCRDLVVVGLLVLQDIALGAAAVREEGLGGLPTAGAQAAGGDGLLDGLGGGGAEGGEAAGLVKLTDRLPVRFHHLLWGAGGLRQGAQHALHAALDALGAAQGQLRILQLQLDPLHRIGVDAAPGARGGLGAVDVVAGHRVGGRLIPVQQHLAVAAGGGEAEGLRDRRGFEGVEHLWREHLHGPALG